MKNLDKCNKMADQGADVGGRQKASSLHFKVYFIWKIAYNDKFKNDNSCRCVAHIFSLDIMCLNGVRL